MALTESNPITIGTLAPDFSLADTVSGDTLGLREMTGEKATIVMFICNHCPFVVHINEQIVQLANEYKSKGVNCIAISSNDVETHPQDSPEEMKQHAAEQSYPFPYLYDATQEVAKAYSAACTPDIYMFDADLKLAYHGQLDSSRPGNDLKCDGSDLRKALDLLLDSWEILSEQKSSMGCNIKWKS